MERDNANALPILRAMEVLANALGPDAPMSYARAFLCVALAGDAGLDQGQMAKQLDASPSSAVRAVQALGKYSWLKDQHGNRKPGLDLIDSVQNSRNLRLRTLTLNANGRRLLARLGGARGGAR